MVYSLYHTFAPCGKYGFGVSRIVLCYHPTRRAFFVSFFSFLSLSGGSLTGLIWPDLPEAFQIPAGSLAEDPRRQRDSPGSLRLPAGLSWPEAFQFPGMDPQWPERL